MMPVTVAMVACLAGAGLAQTEGEKVGQPDERDVRRRLRAVCGTGGVPKFPEYGERAFPVYLRILAAPDAKFEADQIDGVLSILSGLKADRSQFLEYAVNGLAYPDIGVRRAAVELLAQIGSERDAAPVTVLLSDANWALCYSAAKTLAAIGGPRELIAFNVWLTATKHGDAELRRHVETCRDELKLRLAKTKK